MTKMYSRTHHDDPLMLAPGTRHGFPVPNAFKKKKKSNSIALFFMLLVFHRAERRLLAVSALYKPISLWNKF